MAEESITPEVAKLTYGEITDEVIGNMRPPTLRYLGIVAVLALGAAWGLSAWMYQIRTGMGVAGLNHPVCWAVYIGNFVFWIGIAHSGTLISAILHLVRSKWRAAVSRSAEAMTIFAVMTAGLFPLVHLGRLWVFYYILPYPSERQLWPNFQSPLVWDVLAVSTYFTVSLIFFYVGMIPDLASARDRAIDARGPGDLRARIYGRLCLGWYGTAAQWRPYGRGYLYFAALATPLVVSVHSIVSWDFAMSLLPGWHTTIFPPYFVAGAIHSGLAMVLVILVPLRRLFRMERIITLGSLESVAKTMLVTTCIMGYAYVVEPFISWYSGDVFERQFSLWRMTGPWALVFWSLVPLNVLIPALFVFPKVRRSLAWLVIIGVAVNVGMWLERVMIVAASTWHDFLPHNWGPYWPTWVEISITAGSFMWFFFWFVLFSRSLPTVAATEVKELLAEQQTHALHVGIPQDRQGHIARSTSGVLAVFGAADDMLEGLRKMREDGYRQLEVFSPVKIGEVDRVLGLPHGPVRFWTLAGALSGLVGGYALALWSASVNGLTVGGKPYFAYIPYALVGFEGTILCGTLGNLLGLIVHARLWKRERPPAYDRRFSRDKFGLFVAAAGEEKARAIRDAKSLGAEEVFEL